MRKIDVRNYDVVIPVPDGEDKTDFYRVKESLEMCLLHPMLRLDGRELLVRGKIVDKISAADGTLMLEDEEYKKLKSAFETVTGFSKNDMEIVRRVLEAEEIEVAETKKGEA